MVLIMKKIKEFFSQSKLEYENLLVNLTRDCWVTNNEIEQLFSILNKQNVSDVFKSKRTNGKALLALKVPV